MSEHKGKCCGQCLWDGVPEVCCCKAIKGNNKTIKADEKLLWESFGEGTLYRTPREAGQALGMAEKRWIYLCYKWDEAGLYDYGVSVDLGWKNQGETE